jgi:hypothetical protein
MKLGIVGSEAAKFTVRTEELARDLIADLLDHGENISDLHIFSGDCHLGGIDQWAREAAELYKIPFTAFPPKNRQWSTGYKPRNIQIAEASDKVICITVKELPPDYKGMKFGLCYHCRTKDHIKSGGCWTVKYAKEKLGKPGEIIVIQEPCYVCGNLEGSCECMFPPEN